MKDPKLPAGWHMKPRKDKGAEATASYCYLTDKFQQYDSTKAAVRSVFFFPSMFFVLGNCLKC